MRGIRWLAIKRLLVSLLLICFLLAFAGCTAIAPPSAPTQPEPSPKIVSAADSLKSISDDLYEAYAEFGLDEDIADYVLFASSLPKDFGDYTLQNKLCIQDHKLTDLEKQFLEEPDKYLQQMFDSYMTEISTIDPNLADKLKIIPFFKEIEIKDVEALEDITSMASRVEYRAILEKIYGKGIGRTMHPVALEKLVWDCYSSELDEPDLSIHSRLADFQEKYNKQMDDTSVTGVKFDVRGISYLDEPQGWVRKPIDEYKFDIAMIRWVLGCDTVRIWGNDDYAFNFVKLATSEGLDVYLQFEPIGEQPYITTEEFKVKLADYTKNAQKYKVKYLSVGNEIELWWKEFGSSGDWGWGPASFDNRRVGKVAKYVDELATVARQSYSGMVTYTDYYASGLPVLNWKNLDVVSLNMYGSDEQAKKYVLNINQIAKSLSKPLFLTELGSLTITEAEQAGGDASVIWKSSVHLDQGKQAEVIEKMLKLAYETKVDGVFIFLWDSSTWSFRNVNELGFGIWDYVKKEPKQSFWSVYKYYRER